MVKANVTPSNYTDPDGTLASDYRVAPVINGVEQDRQGLSVLMLSTLSGQAGQGGRGAVHYIPLKPAPDPVPLAHFTYRGKGNRFDGPSTNLNAANMVIPGTDGQNWSVVDMDLLKGFRVAYEDQTTVTQEQLDGWVAELNEKNTTPNALGDATYATPVSLTSSLVAGKITETLYRELEAEFINYVENLDAGPSLPYAKTASGAIFTQQSHAHDRGPERRCPSRRQLPVRHRGGPQQPAEQLGSAAPRRPQCAAPGRFRRQHP